MIAALLTLAATPTHAGDLKRLGTHTAEATSWHTTDRGRFVGDHHPTFALDDDRATAWVEGADGDGVGERIRIPVSRLKTANRLQVRIRNGNQSSDKAMENGPAPRDVVLRTFMGDREQVSETVTLTRERGWQEFVVQMPGKKGFDAVSLEIASVHDGRSSKAAISDIQLLVDSDVPHDPGLEEGRREVLDKALRRLEDMGRYFGGTIDDSPFASSQYTIESAELPVPRAEQGMVKAREQLQRLSGKDQRHDIVVNRPIERPGGAYDLEHVVDLFAPETLTIVETDREIAEREPPPDEAWWAEWIKSTAHVQFAKGTEIPQRIHFDLRTVAQERGTSESDAKYLVKFDDRGRVDFVYSSSRFNYDGWESGTREVMLRFDKDDRGRITGWEQTSLTRSKNPDGKHQSAGRQTAVATAGT